MIGASKVRDVSGASLVDFLGVGSQTLIPPSIHPGNPKLGIASPGQYRWVKGTLEGVELGELPVITPADLDDIRAELGGLAGKPQKRPTVAIDPVALAMEARVRYAGVAPASLRALSGMLSGKPKGQRSDCLFAFSRAIGWAVVNGFLTQDAVYAALLGACAANGLAKENGETDCVRTIGNGLALADGLPELREQTPEWERRQRQKAERDNWRAGNFERMGRIGG
jgi:hypothetical protein